MPYEYRKLNPEEQKQLVERRKQRGHPLHQPPHPFREEGSYLITAANFEHAPIMASPARRSEFQDLLLQTLRQMGSEIGGWVILPNHYHLLGKIKSLNLLSDALKQLHGTTSYQWNKQDGLTGKRKVWYRFVDRAMRDEAHYYCALNYIHYNPVKHGYTQDAYSWPWSSLAMYEEGNGREWMSEQWKKFTPAPDFGKDWDEND